MANDLEYSLGLDVSPLQRAGASVAKFGGDTVKVLNSKFSGADIFKSLITGVGLASVGQLAEKLTAPFRESAESAQNIAQYTDAAAAATERLLSLRQSDAQQLDTMVKQAKRLGDELEAAVNRPATKKFFGFIDRGSAVDKLFGFSRREDAGKQELIAQKDAELKQKSVDVEVKKQAIKRQGNTEALKAVKEQLAQEDKRADAIKKLAAFEREERMAKLTDEQRAAELEKERRAVTKEIAEYKKFTREGGQLNAAGVTELIGLKEKQKDIESEIADITSRKVAAEQAVGDVIESNIAKWEGLVLSISTFGRGNKDLSDRELSRKILELNADVSSRQSAVFNGRGSGVGSFGGYDPLLSPQQSQLSQAMAELNFRQKLRSDVSTFGEERAFAMNPGVTEQRFAEILRGYSTEQEKLTKSIDQLNRNVQAIPPALQAINN